MFPLEYLLDETMPRLPAAIHAGRTYDVHLRGKLVPPA